MRRPSFLPFLLGTLVSLLVAPGPVAAQRPAQALEGRHLVHLGFGAVNVTGEVSASLSEGAVVYSGIQLSSKIGYRFWMAEGWALAIDAGALSLDSEVTASLTDVSVVSTSTTFVAFGVRAQPAALLIGNVGRPWFELSLGAATASTASVQALPPAVGADSQTVPTARFSVGLDFVPHHRFLISVGGRYNLLADFDEPVAGQINMSSVEGEVGFGILLGGRRE